METHLTVQKQTKGRALSRYIGTKIPQLPHSDLTILQPVKGLRGLQLGELWQYRELLYFLTWRNIKLRYKQTVLGVAWAVLQPLLAVIVSSLIFGRLAHMPSDGIAYPLFFYAGNLPWILMASGVGSSAASLVGSPNLITRVYFPRMIIPAAAVLSGLIDFLIAAAGLAFLMVRYHIAPSWQLLLVAPVLIQRIFFTLRGVSCTQSFT